MTDFLTQQAAQHAEFLISLVKIAILL
ncbi:MAG: hypothetical protein JWO71_778, partial [Candidatus Acidoferrum typicum]|nr:hypothetical protein [Candidatus Acidoferrum typicum]